MTGLAALSCLSAFVIFGLALLASFSRTFYFWPPKAGDPQSRRRVLWLFRAMLYPLILASVLALVEFGLPSKTPLLIGLALLIGGLVIAVTATLHMGWANAFGADQGLSRTGLFRSIRHPIYSATFLAMVGWAMIVPLPLVRTTLLFWAGFYLIASVLEERYLLSKYGGAYARHMELTERFWPRLLRNRDRKQ